MMNYGSLKAAIKEAKRVAYADAKETGKPHRRIGVNGRPYTEPSMPFTRARGPYIYTLSLKTGRCKPHADEPPEYGGTKGELVALVSDIVANHPECDEVAVGGGYDISELMNFDDYEPDVASWDVLVWTRADGWKF